MHNSRFYENENKHEVAIHENKHARGRPKGKSYTIATVQKALTDRLPSGSSIDHASVAV